jgi:predicted Holliday junction resolvase-like endonuclease
MTIAVAIAGICFGLLCVALNIIIKERRQHRLDLEDCAQRAVKLQSKNTEQQRATIKGQLAEQLFPLSEYCEYFPSDMRFMGDFCDYVVIDGYTQCKDEGSDYIKQVVFVEIKTGKAQLSRHQKLIRDAVEAGRVRWDTVRIH